MNIRSVINTLLEPFQVQLTRTNRKCLGTYPFRDMRRLCRSESPVIVDCGANRGQTIANLRNHFTKAQIHAFEPATDTFRALDQRYGDSQDVWLNNCGLGSAPCERTFHEGQASELSSFLPFGDQAYGALRGTDTRPIIALADYCRQRQMTHVDILKSDTQGFELEVLRGAEPLLDAGCIQLVYLELIFSQAYVGLPDLDEVYRYLYDRGFRLVSFYQFGFRDQTAHTTDALFLNPQFSAAGNCGSAAA